MMMISKRHAFLALALFLAAIFLSAGINGMRKGSGSKQDQQSDAGSLDSRDPRPERKSRRTSSQSVDALRERFRRAAKNNTENEVFRRILAELRGLDAEELLGLLDGADSANDDSLDGSYLRVALFQALWGIDRGLAAEYAITAPEDDRLRYCVQDSIDLWVGENAVGFIGWVDSHRQELSGNVIFFRQAEGAVIRHLLNFDPAAAMERVKHLPQEIMRDVATGLSSALGDLISPDQAIDFLRESLSRTDHEDAVGRACGMELYRQEETAIQAFFRKHDTSRKEGEAILFQAVKMDMGMGIGGDSINAFNGRMRAIAEAEGFENANSITAVILGISSDRDHQDKQAVDELLSYDPEPSALEVFLGERGGDMDAAQRMRVTERIRVLRDSM